MLQTQRTHKFFLFWMVLGSSLILSQSGKRIYFSDVRCLVTGNKIANITCSLRDNTSLYIIFQTNKVVLANLVGISRVALNTIGSKKIQAISGMRLDICEIIAGAHRPSIISFVSRGLRESLVEFPKKCPLKPDTTYTVHNMSFDSNAFTNFQPDYNFTYSGLFLANNVHSFEVWVWGTFN